MGVGEPDVVIDVGVSGPGVVNKALQRAIESAGRQLTLSEIAEIIKPDGGHGVVNVGSKVKILDDLNEETEYEIVGTTEADISVGRISNESPLGKALIGAKLGDTVTVKAPKCSYQVKILGIDG